MIGWLLLTAYAAVSVWVLCRLMVGVVQDHRNPDVECATWAFEITWCLFLAALWPIAMLANS